MKFVDVKKLKELIKDADDDALIILMNGSGDVELIGDDSIDECKQMNEGGVFFINEDDKRIGEKVFVLQSDMYHYKQWVKSNELIDKLNKDGIL
jgi:FixJ family two-component response regulator